MNLSSILTHGMWAILVHSRPLSLLHCFFNKGHPSIYNCKSEDGKPTSGNDVSFGQFLIRKRSSDVKFRKPLEDRCFNSGNFAMASLVREVGNIIPSSSCGKDTASRHPPIERFLREVSLCSPHSINGLYKLKSSIVSVVREVGKPSRKGHDSSTLTNF